jgi:preprotein translocase subunit SecA
MNAVSKRNKRFLAEVAAIGQSLRSAKENELQKSVGELREKAISKPAALDSLVAPVVAASMEAIRRVLGYELYGVQIQAAQTLIDGKIAEMHTGEGKTISAVPAAVFAGIQGKGAHVATTTAYLAQRDCAQLKPIYEMLGLSVGVLQQPDAGSGDNRSAYDCDITYGTGSEFGFDYLRDQVELKKQLDSRLGLATFDRITRRTSRSGRTTMMRGQAFSIVDEADNVMVDDASSPLVLSMFQPGVAEDAEAVLLAQQVAAELTSGEHFDQSGRQQVRLTDQGQQFVHRRAIAIPVQQLQRPWTTYVETAVRARLQFHKGIDYVVRGEEVQIVDQSTGKIYQDRSWQDGLQQAVESKEGVPVTPEMVPLAKITRQRFLCLYDHLCGMTGTAASCEAELTSVYDLGVVQIPLRLPSQRNVMRTRAFESAEQKWEAIVDSVLDFHRQQRPVLIGTRTIEASQTLAGYLESAAVDFQMLNGLQDAQEADIVSRAGERGAITIATNLAGRGTDIKLDDCVKEIGGLHVIVSECHQSFRFDRQLMGRCARQGEPGSCQTFISAEDWLPVTHGRWLSETIQKIAVKGEVEIDLQPSIRKIQETLERSSFADRLATLARIKTQNDTILGQYH